MSDEPTDKERAAYWERKHEALDNMLFAKFGQKDPEKAIDDLLREKKAREYYQEIVYHICQVLDRIDGKEPGHGIVCGTLETPSTEVQERMDKLIEDFRRLKYDKTTAFAIERDAYEKEAKKWKKAYLDMREQALLFAHQSADGCGCEHNRADPGCPVPCIPCQARKFIREEE